MLTENYFIWFAENTARLEQAKDEAEKEIALYRAPSETELWKKVEEVVDVFLGWLCLFFWSYFNIFIFVCIEFVAMIKDSMCSTLNK